MLCFEIRVHDLGLFTLLVESRVLCFEIRVHDLGLFTLLVRPGDRVDDSSARPESVNSLHSRYVPQLDRSVV